MKAGDNVKPIDAFGAAMHMRMHMQKLQDGKTMPGRGDEQEQEQDGGRNSAVRGRASVSGISLLQFALAMKPVVGGPAEGGVYLPLAPLLAFEQGKFRRGVSVMMGTVHDEVATFIYHDGKGAEPGERERERERERAA
jgi:hypothetical protein